MHKMLQAAVEHHQAGRLPQAEELYRQVLQEAPNQPDALHLLGVIFLQRGDIDSALDLIGRAINAEPARANYYFSLGNALKAQGHPDEAIPCYQKALLLKPDYVSACYNLGDAFRAQGLLNEAAVSYRQTILLKPDYVEAHINLGYVLQTLGKLDEAAICYRQAISNLPDSVVAHSNLGLVLRIQGKLDEAAACYRQALLLKPDHVDGLSGLGVVLMAQGRMDEAVDCYRQAISLKPDYADAHCNLIFALDMQVGADAPTLQAERWRWNEAYADGLYGAPSFSNRPDPERRLRIGYVSADFREHSAAVVFGAMLTRFDPAAFDVYAYSNSVTEDDHTRLFQQSVTCWKKIVGLSDAAVADLIRQDGIDLLVDLSGFTAGNRLLAFARKPAPIQITAWGYVGGTGMKAMDVFLADPVVVPPEEKSLYAEDVRYLPSFVSAFFPNPFPAVNELPALAAKGVTFGSFNRLCKVSIEAYRTWVQVLQAVPGSRMIIKTGELDDPGTRERVLSHFIRAGIDPARITLLGKTPWPDHMAAFNRIDISLDPYPHGGGVTALEGLMMGVPAVTLRWPTIPGRLSVSILTTLGLTDWIVETPEQYVRLAVQKAQDLTALAGLRQQLRPCFMASIIGDTTSYVRVVEQEYRKLWREWCASQLEQAADVAAPSVSISGDIAKTETR